jgi:hypothetical protein
MKGVRAFGSINHHHSTINNFGQEAEGEQLNT